MRKFRANIANIQEIMPFVCYLFVEAPHF